MPSVTSPARPRRSRVALVALSLLVCPVAAATALAGPPAGEEPPKEAPPKEAPPKEEPPKEEPPKEEPPKEEPPKEEPPKEEPPVVVPPPVEPPVVVPPPTTEPSVAVPTAAVPPPAPVARVPAPRTSARLRVTKTGPTTVRAGGLASFRIRVVNTGTGVAGDVRLSDVLPAGFSLVTRGSSAGVVRAGRPSWRIGRLAPGSARVVRVLLRADAGIRGGRCNRAIATTPGVRAARDRHCFRVQARPVRSQPAVTG